MELYTPLPETPHQPIQNLRDDHHTIIKNMALEIRHSIFNFHSPASNMLRIILCLYLTKLLQIFIIHRRQRYSKQCIVDTRRGIPQFLSALKIRILTWTNAVTFVARCDTQGIRQAMQLPGTLETRHLESDDFALCDGFDDSEVALELSQGDQVGLF